METINYKTFGTCSRAITIEIEGDIIKNVIFDGGCSGNTQGLAKLCVGRDIHDVISSLEGIKCGPKPTSCPDQLAKALRNYLESK